MNTHEIEYYKQNYPPGTRIELINMDDPYAPVPSGTRGTVKLVDDMGTLHIKWDNGHSLGVIPDADAFHKLTAKEIEEEQQKATLETKIQSIQTSAHEKAKTYPQKDSPERF